MKEAIRKEDLLSLKKLGVKEKKQLMKRGMRKLKKPQLQQELETGQSEMMIEERKRIASNAIFFRFGKKLRRRNEDEETTPDLQTNLEFWRGLDENGDDAQHDEREETPTRMRERITLNEVEVAVKNTPNWKAPGPDGIQGFWWKYLPSTWKGLCGVFNSWLEDPRKIPMRY